ncbi:MAG: hypothetical protein ABIQ70_00980 [Dokdonella sp.]
MPMTSGAADDISVQREAHDKVSGRRANATRFDPLNSRLGRNGLLLILVALMLARIPYAAATMDLARDVFIGLRVLNGEAFPLTGPIFGGVFHLGPVWDYLLALLLALCGRHWQAVIAALGLMIAMQIPLAYLAGKALDQRRTGMLWAFLLTLPSWDTFQFLLPSHPSLVAPFALAFLLCAIRQWRQPRTRYLLGMAFTFILALHAHPSSIALTWLGLPVLVQTWRSGSLRARDVVLALLIVVLPVVPLLVWDAMHGFTDAGAAARYAVALAPMHTLANTWALIHAVVVDGAAYWFTSIFGWSRHWVMLAALTLTTSGALAALGFAQRVRIPAQRLLPAFALVITMAVAVATSALRDITPFYMASPLHVVACGALALGLSGLGATPFAIGARGIVIVGALIIGVAIDVGTARLQTRGAFPFGWWPLADIKHEVTPTTPTLLMPAYAMAASGRFLCNQSKPAVHGSYANHLLLNYAIEMRLNCGRADVQLGGSDPQRQHWLGLTRAMFARLDVDPIRRLGPLGLVRARAVPFGRSMEPAPEPRYPAYLAAAGPEQERQVSVSLAAREYLVVSDTAFLLDRGYTIQATVNGRALEPKASDSVSRIYACEECNLGGTANIELTMRSANPDDLDVVVFNADAPG